MKNDKMIKFYHLWLIKKLYIFLTGGSVLIYG